MSRLKGLARAAAFSGLLVFTILPGTPDAQAVSGPMMVTGGPTSQPIGHFEFCKRRPAECAVRSPRTGPVAYSTALWNKIANVNLQVNRTVKPRSDSEIYGRPEFWTYPSGVGDCEDYALEKRRILMKRGVPLSALLITVVRKPDGEGHAVLTVHTDAGDYVLDNLNDRVVAFNETGYRFLKRQSAEHSGRWVSIRGGSAAPLVGAVKALTN